MTQNIDCRRASARCKLSYRVRLHIPGEPSWTPAVTNDVSSEGFYCTSAHPFRPHAQLDCEIVIPTGGAGPAPPAVVSRSQLVLRCRVEVVRLVARGLDPGYGIACRIEHYNVDERDPARVAGDWHEAPDLESTDLEAV